MESIKNLEEQKIVLTQKCQTHEIQAQELQEKCDQLQKITVSIFRRSDIWYLHPSSRDRQDDGHGALYTMHWLRFSHSIAVKESVSSAKEMEILKDQEITELKVQVESYETELNRLNQV